MKRTLGVIDSGLGGLSVLNALRTVFPGDDFVYIGDFSHAPYGTRSLEVVAKRVRRLHDWLLKTGMDTFVIACNTATIATADETFLVPTQGVVALNIKTVEGLKQAGPILVLATDLTVEQGVYQRDLSRLGRFVVAEKSQALVALVENQPLNTAHSHEVVKKHCAPHLGTNFAAIVLGCTHFSWLKQELHACFPHSELVDGLTHLIKTLEYDQSNVEQKGTLRLISTGDVATLYKMKRFLQSPPNSEDVIDIPD